MIRESGNIQQPRPEIVLGSDLARQVVLDEILSKEHILPDFSHLKRYPETAGPFVGMQDVLETSLGRFYVSSRPQVIAVIGHHAMGKTSNIKLGIDYIEERSSRLGSPIKPTLVAYDSAIETISQLKDRNQDVIEYPLLEQFDSKSTSGERNSEFYRSVNFIFRNAIRTAISEGGIIFVEAPAIGIKREKGRRILGQDRGTSTIRMLSSGEDYQNLAYDLTVAALVADPKLFLENVRKRESESTIDSAKRPGATAVGTEAANQEVAALLSELKITSNDFATELARIFLPWELYNYFLLSWNQAVILKNTSGNVPVVTKDQLSPYDIFKKIDEGELSKWLLAHEV